MGEGWYDVPWMRYDYGKPGAEVAAKDRAATPALVSVNLYTGQYDGQLVSIPSLRAVLAWHVAVAQHVGCCDAGVRRGHASQAPHAVMS